MTSKNELLFERSQRTIPGGVNSPVRAFRAVGGTPPFIERGQGSRIYDVDGSAHLPQQDFIRGVRIRFQQAFICDDRCVLAGSQHRRGTLAAFRLDRFLARRFLNSGGAFVGACRRRDK